MKPQQPGWDPMSHEEYIEWSREELGEIRQVYARDMREPPDAPLVYMPENEADRFRRDARKGHLICPVPGCPRPRLIARHYGHRRDHFAHACGSKLSHVDYPTAVVQRMLHCWAAGLDEGNQVLDDQVIGGVRVTVLVKLTHGERVALCYVNRCLGVDAWKREQTALERSGVAGVWIFPRNDRYFNAPKPQSSCEVDTRGLVCDQLLFKSMRQNGSWPLFLRAERERVANMIVPGKKVAARLGIEPPPLVENVLHLVASQLKDCSLCKDGIVTGAVTARDLEKIRSGYRSDACLPRPERRYGPTPRRSWQRHDQRDNRNMYRPTIGRGHVGEASYSTVLARASNHRTYPRSYPESSSTHAKAQVAPVGPTDATRVEQSRPIEQGRPVGKRSARPRFRRGRSAPKRGLWPVTLVRALLLWLGNLKSDHR